MPDTIPEPGPEPEVDRYAMPEPEVDRYAMPEPEVDRYAMPEPEVDRYAMPEPDEIVSTYVRNEAPWVGIRGVVANPDLSALADAPSVPGDEPEFTRVVRARRRWREAVAWLVTAAFILAGAWFLPVLLVPTTSLGRVGSFATLSVGGLVALVTLVQTWRWAYRAE
jgi:hypothetical protein